MPPPPGGDTAAASTDNSMPPPPAESAAAAPAQEESQAPAEEPVKVVKSKKSGHKVAAGTSRYSVHKGDSLWRISGKDSVYGDSFKWPLLFKANRPNIDDPDLIYPRQALKVSKRFTQEEETDAVEKAKETPPFQPHSEPRKKLPIKY
jgi:nucleoid-associated protein YgaU